MSPVIRLVRNKLYRNGISIIFNYNYVIVMAKETIQIRINEETAMFVNRLLLSGIFKSKSEALRYILSMGISATKKFPEISAKVEKLKFMEKSTGRISIDLSGSLKELLVNRDRFN
jgi:hypothetical protein